MIGTGPKGQPCPPLSFFFKKRHARRWSLYLLSLAIDITNIKNFFDIHKENPYFYTMNYTGIWNYKSPYTDHRCVVDIWDDGSSLTFIEDYGEPDTYSGVQYLVFKENLDISYIGGYLTRREIKPIKVMKPFKLSE